jgi:toxin-antitoxin system PIN domain toxin
MNLADTNFWLALALSKHQFHAAARHWFDRQSKASVLLCRSTQQSLLRLLTTDAVHRPYGSVALTNSEAWTFHRDLRSDRRCRFSKEPAALEAQWNTMSERESASPKLWMDAYLAAFAVSGNHGFVTTDQAFKQFAGLRLILLTKAGRPVP